MALDQVGKNKIEIYSQKPTGEIYSVVAVGEATIDRSPNAPSSLKLKIRRNHEGQYTPEDGDSLAFILDGEHDMFFGYITSTTKSSDFIDITAHDQLWYMNKSSYSKSYGTLPASELLIKMADDFGYNMVNPPNVEDTVYPIINVILDNAKPLDIITDALNITYEHTGVRYFVYDAFNNLCLARGDHQETLKVNTLCINHFNCKDYTYDEDIENLINRVEVRRESTEGQPAEVVVSENKTLVDKYGTLQYTTTAKEGENMQQLADDLLNEKCQLTTKLHCSEVIGDPRVFGGSNVFVDLFTNGLEDQREFIRGWFQVDSVTHKFSNATHYMDLDLSLLWMFDNWDYGGIDPDYYE